MIIQSRRSNMPKVSIGKQKGVALVLAIMIVALVTAISVEITWRFDLNLARSANRWHGMQARAYVEGAEQLAKIALRYDAEIDNSEDGVLSDNFGEVWAQENPPFPTDEGWVKGTIEDALGRFNINSLMAPLPSSEGRILEGCPKYAPAHRRFIRLLQTVNLATGTITGAERGEIFSSLQGDETNGILNSNDNVSGSELLNGSGEEEYMRLEDAEAITEAVIDWLDVDDNPTGFNGAEGEYYDRLEPPLTIANGPMASVTELQVIKGMTPPVYKALLDYIIALPPEAGLNLNTATYPVMRTMASGSNCELTPLSIEDTDVLIQAVRGGEFASIQEFKEDPDVEVVMSLNGSAPMEGEGDLKFRSNFFLVYSEAMVGEHLRKGSSLLFRYSDEDTHRVDTLRRTDAHF